jgi:hypothetical protein
MNIDEVDDSSTSGYSRRSSGDLGSRSSSSISSSSCSSSSISSSSTVSCSMSTTTSSSKKKAAKVRQRSSSTASALGIPPRMWTVAAYETGGQPVEEVPLLQTGSPLIAEEDPHICSSIPPKSITIFPNRNNKL